MSMEAKRLMGRRPGGLCRHHGAGDRPTASAGPCHLSDAAAPVSPSVARQLAALKEELLYFAAAGARRHGSRVVIWTDDAEPCSGWHACSCEAPGTDTARLTPPYLAEKIPTWRRASGRGAQARDGSLCESRRSTELIRDLDPEQAQALLERALHAMRDAVHRFEGTVNQVLGDGVRPCLVPRWPTRITRCGPVRCPGDADGHAPLCGGGAPRPWSGDAGPRGAELGGSRRAGHWQRPAHGLFGRGPDHALSGALEQLAIPGSIRLTAATLRLAEGLVQVNALGQFPVKGLTEPVEVFELVGASAIRRRSQASVARGLTRFVGRQQELLALQQALAQAEMGHGQVAAMVGEAGVGKSRLIYEFVHSHHTPGWLVLESASVSYGKATPYVPVIDLLRRYSHVEEPDDPRTIGPR